MKPKVSVVVPIYNGEGYIDVCFQNMRKQTYDNLEVIAINDGSTDKTLQYLKKYPEIIIYSISNGGVSNARNYGLSKATGDYILFLDVDDYLDSNAIEKMVQAFTDNVDLVRINYIWETEENRIIKRKEEQIYSKNQMISKDYLLDELSNGNSNSYCVLCLYPKGLLKKKKFNSTLKFLEDVLFYVDVLENVKNIHVIKDVYYHYIYNQNSSSRDSSKIILNVENVKMFNQEFIKSLNKTSQITEYRIIERNNIDVRLIANLFGNLVFQKNKRNWIKIVSDTLDDEYYDKMFNSVCYNKSFLSKPMVMAMVKKEYQKMYFWAIVRAIMLKILGRKM